MAQRSQKRSKIKNANVKTSQNLPEHWQYFYFSAAKILQRKIVSILRKLEHCVNGVHPVTNNFFTTAADFFFCRRRGKKLSEIGTYRRNKWQCTPSPNWRTAKSNPFTGTLVNEDPHNKVVNMILRNSLKSGRIWRDFWLRSGVFACKGRHRRSRLLRCLRRIWKLERVVISLDRARMFNTVPSRSEFFIFRPE